MVGRTDGFTLVEFLVAALITLVATAVAVAVVTPAGAAFQALPESADLLQRVRVAADALRNDLAAAGSGPSLAWGAGGALAWPAVLPCRWTGSAMNALSGGCATSDGITIVTMAVNAPQAIAAASIGDATAPIPLSAASACTLDRTACRLHAGNLLLIVDGSSTWDLVKAASVSSDGRLVSTARRASPAYAVGALVGEATARAYFQAIESGTGIPQLRRADDGGNSYSLVDHVVSLSFEYFGAAEPPLVVVSADASERAASYGPTPPPPGTDNPLDTWGAGENCLFAADGNAQTPRLPVLAPAESGFARLPLASFSDGPWCPDGSSANRFDADLFRVRMVRVTIRVQAQSAGVRGTVRSVFVQPGETRDASRLVPDRSITFDVLLRNLLR